LGSPAAQPPSHGGGNPARAPGESRQPRRPGKRAIPGRPGMAFADPRRRRPLTNGAPSPPDQLRKFARRYTDAWCSQDPARVAEHYAPDGSLTINDGPPSLGRAAIAEAARSFMIAFPDLQVRMDDLLIHGDKAE